MLAKNVPLIHEKIILFLDYETFKKSGDVCKPWRDLHASETMQRKAKYVYSQEMKEEKEMKLLKAAWLGDAKEVSHLLSMGISPNYVDKGGRTAIWYANRSYHVEVVKLLLNAGANRHDMNLPHNWCHNCLNSTAHV